MYDYAEAWRVLKFTDEDTKVLYIYVLYDFIVEADRSGKPFYGNRMEAIYSFNKDGNVIHKHPDGDLYRGVEPTFYANSADAKRNFANTTDEEWINLIREKLK